MCVALVNFPQELDECWIVDEEMCPPGETIELVGPGAWQSDEGRNGSLLWKIISDLLLVFFDSHLMCGIISLQEFGADLTLVSPALQSEARSDLGPDSLVT